MNKKNGIGIWIVLLLLLTVLVPDFVSAHADVKTSSPSEKEILDKSPSSVQIEFREQIEPSSFNSLTVTSESGERVDVGDAHIDKNNPRLMKVGLKKNLPNGIYSAQWRIISTDGHPIEGTIPFGIKITKKEAKALQADTSGYIPKADMVINRGVMYTSFAFYIGVIFFNLVIAKGGYKQQSTRIQSRSRKMIWLSLFGMLMSSLLNLPLQATITAGVPWSEAFAPVLLKETMELSSFGYYWSVQVSFVTLLVITTFLAMKRGKLSSLKTWSIPLILFLGVLIARALNSHASASEYREIAIFMNFSHLIAASLWVGGVSSIVFILPISKKGTKNEEDWLTYWDAIRRFSRWAWISGSVVLLTGIVNSTVFVSTFHALTNSDYGVTLLMKIAFFVGMSLLGLVHLIKGMLRRKKGLGATVGVELSVGIILMLLAGILTNLQPPSLLEAKPFNETKELKNGYQITLKISPNAVGVNTFNILVRDKDGNPTEDIERMIMRVAAVGMGMEKPSFGVDPIAPGRFEIQGRYLTMVGQWRIQVRVLTTKSESLKADFFPVVGSRERDATDIVEK